MKEAGWVRLLIADMAWLLLFLSLWAALLLLWNTWWAIILVPAFAFMMTGFSEMMHQGAHGNLCGRVRVLNNMLGRIAGAAIGVDMVAYREFHLQHHRLVNTPDDSERPIYADPRNVAIAAGWKDRSCFGKAWGFTKSLAYYMRGMLTSFNPNAWLLWVVRLGIPLAIAGIGYLEGLRELIVAKVLVCWYLPFFLYFFPDFFLAQSEHYGTMGKPSAERVAPDEQYQISWNLKLPWPLGFMTFSRNMHAEHHQYPGIHWWYAIDQKAGRTFSVFAYLKQWWADGPRVVS